VKLDTKNAIKFEETDESDYNAVGGVGNNVRFYKVKSRGQ